MKTYKCDRCGKRIDWACDRVKLVMKFGNIAYDDKKYDLCSECAVKIYEVLEGE